MSHPDTEQTYQALRRAILTAKEAGVRIVCEQFYVRKGIPTKPCDSLDLAEIVGCCAVTAGRLFSEVALEDEEAICVARGFDGLLPGLLRDEEETSLYQVGLRLRDEFNPITATELERELGVTS